MRVNSLQSARIGQNKSLILQGSLMEERTWKARINHETNQEIENCWESSDGFIVSKAFTPDCVYVFTSPDESSPIYTSDRAEVVRFISEWDNKGAQ